MERVATWLCWCTQVSCQTQMEEEVVFDRPQERNQPSGGLQELYHGKKTLGQVDKEVQPLWGLSQEGLGSASGPTATCQGPPLAYRPRNLLEGQKR